MPTVSIFLCERINDRHNCNKKSIATEGLTIFLAFQIVCPFYFRFLFRQNWFCGKNDRNPRTWKREHTIDLIALWRCSYLSAVSSVSGFVYKISAYSVLSSLIRRGATPCCCCVRSNSAYTIPPSPVGGLVLPSCTADSTVWSYIMFLTKIIDKKILIECINVMTCIYTTIYY